MPIQVSRGPMRDHALTVSFNGSDSNSSSSVSDLYLISNVTADIDSVDSDKVFVKNDRRSAEYGHDSVEVGPTHYSEWRGEDGETFISASEVETYLNNLFSTSTTSLRRRFSEITDPPYEVGINTGSNFTYQFTVDGGLAYYWRESDFPVTLSVSQYDNRIITGSIDQPGTYDLNCDVRNAVGISSVVLRLLMT